ncbi:hypothetical protein DL771_006994 [Monosporascus sp. 5C6A]|nr:hypothetical protein DL771_006994 [Monosporascus sp. 5C6A]
MSFSSNHRAPPPPGVYRQPCLYGHSRTFNLETPHEMPLAGLSFVSDPEVSESLRSVIINATPDYTPASCEPQAETKPNKKQTSSSPRTIAQYRMPYPGSTRCEIFWSCKSQRRSKSRDRNPPDPKKHKPKQNASTKTKKSTGNKFSDFEQDRHGPEQPINGQLGADRQSWVDDEYYVQNPWYGQPNQKPKYKVDGELVEQTEDDEPRREVKTRPAATLVARVRAKHPNRSLSIFAATCHDLCEAFGKPRTATRHVRDFLLDLWFAFKFGIYLGGGVSGAHMNPQSLSALGYGTGSSPNPASDFGPRLVAYLVGYSAPEIFNDPWWICGPWSAASNGSLASYIYYDSMIFFGSESPH